MLCIIYMEGVMSIYKSLLNYLTANNYKLFFLYMLLLSIASLGFAYFVEFVIGVDPCILCLYQRIPYFILAIVSIGGLALSHYKCMVKLIILIFLSSTILAGYHTGVERGVINPTDRCTHTNNMTVGASFDEMLEKLYSTPLADCSKPAFKMFGVSMTEWNLILSLCLFIMSIIIYCKRK